MREIANRIDKQLTCFAEEIGWFIYGSSPLLARQARAAGKRSVLIGRDVPVWQFQAAFFISARAA